MTAPARRRVVSQVTDALPTASAIDLRGIRESLERSGGGRHVAHTSAAFEIRIEVFNSPGPGEVRVEESDVLYLVLEGSGVLGIENNDTRTLIPSEATVVPAGTRHALVGSPRLTLLTVATPGWAAYGEVRSTI
jgi:mannose-6-phosphate isomerase-like protein (cupin superfamily)